MCKPLGYIDLKAHKLMKLPKIELANTSVVLARDEIIRSSQWFDPNWYASTYKDVAMLGMDPLEHFLRIGEALDRCPCPDFDTKFYRETYAIWHPSGSPFADYLTAKDFQPRPTTHSALEQTLVKAATNAKQAWGPVGDKKISYCIPVMNRLDDIKGTLACNLKANAIYRGDVEFLVIEFGASREVSEWISSDPVFGQALEDGFLRIVSDFETLNMWHFGRAKNAFRKHLRGQIYSSLDADNFVTADETAWLLDVAKEHPLGFVAHHFSGDFLDGTCGRVSLPTVFYRSVGYDPLMFPRNWDEIDLMLGAMKHFPAAPLIVAGLDRNIMRYDFSMRDFVCSEEMPNPTIPNEYPARISPLNPKPIDFMRKNPKYKHYDTFNASFGCCRMTRSTAHQLIYMQNAQVAGRQLVQLMPADELIKVLFEQSERLEALEPNKLCVLTSARDEADFLPHFLAHYRRLGVDRFYIVDDGSKIPISHLNLGRDVVVVRPKVGDFKTSKGLWLGALSKFLVPEGAWMITVDVDELVQVPNPFKGFKDLIAHLDERGDDLIPGLLLDMLPRDPIVRFNDQIDPVGYFDSFCWMPTPVDQFYERTSCIRWGFGEHTELSWRVDARYHAFGTVDSLRKIPLLRRRPGWHLNEGFHTLLPLDKSVGRQLTPKIFEQSIILPVFHYKLSRLWSDEARSRMVEILGHYDPRTRQNIASYFKPAGGVEKLAALKPHLRPKEDALNGHLSVGSTKNTEK